jgi:hypothetical protein
VSVETTQSSAREGASTISLSLSKGGQSKFSTRASVRQAVIRDNVVLVLPIVSGASSRHH